MFGQAELDRLRTRKQLLVLQSQASRLTLVAECQRLRSMEFWQAEAGHVARRHPWLTAALAVGAGIAAIKVIRRPGALLGLLGKVGGAGSVLMSAWKMFSSK